MKRSAAALVLFGSFVISTQAMAEIKDYAGPFTTEVLYTLCTQPDRLTREKCDLYLKGLMYGLSIQRSMQEQGMPVCLPEMNVEEARTRILKFIAGTTGGRPSNNKDGGDWMAFMGLAAGNICKK